MLIDHRNDLFRLSSSERGSAVPSLEKICVCALCFRTILLQLVQSCGKEDTNILMLSIVVLPMKDILNRISAFQSADIRRNINLDS